MLSCLVLQRSPGVSAGLRGLVVVLLVVAVQAAAVTDPALATREREIARLIERVLSLQNELAALQQELVLLRIPDDKTLASVSVGGATSAPTVAPQVAVVGPVVSTAGDVSVYGDGRLRYESTSPGAGQRGRYREVLRARVSLDYAFSPRITLGARVVTGDPDDPNSSDVTLGDFMDDLQVGLDRAFVRYQGDSFLFFAGKFANPFRSRDLLWDGDVNPQGLALSHHTIDREGFRLGVTGAFFPVDHQAVGSDSYMAGAQLLAAWDYSPAWKLELGSAYYDHRIGSLTAADAGDIRDNRLTPEGDAYLSGFELLDTLAVLEYRGLGVRWPVSMALDYVENLAAVDAESSAYQMNLDMGRTRNRGDWRLAYGYAQADIDSVLTAFSQDNIGYASNYRLHSLQVEYAPMEDIVLNMTAYHYRRDRLQPGYPDHWDEWISRIRFNVNIQF